MYNEFSHRIEKVKNSHGKRESLEWSDSDTVLLRAFLDETKKFKVDKNTIMASLYNQRMQDIITLLKRLLKQRNGTV